MGLADPRGQPVQAPQALGLDNTWAHLAPSLAVRPPTSAPLCRLARSRPAEVLPGTAVRPQRGPDQTQRLVTLEWGGPVPCGPT